MKTTTQVDDYTEDTLVEQPAIKLFKELGWEVANAFSESVTEHPITERELDTEVILIPRLHRALQKLNPEIPEQGLKHAIDQLTADRSTKLLVRTNQEVYDLIKNGVRVIFQKSDGEQCGYE